MKKILGSKELEVAQADLNKNIKEFDNIMDNKIAKFKKEKSVFDSLVIKVGREQKAEQSRLDLRSKIQAKEKESMSTTRIEYTEGIERNKADSKRYSELLKEVTGDKETLISEGNELARKIKEVKQLQLETKNSHEIASIELKTIEDKKAKLIQEKKKVEGVRGEQQSKEQELIGLKSKYSNGILNNKELEKGIKERGRALDEQEAYFIKITKSLEERERKISSLEEDLRAREINLDTFSDEINAKIKEYYALKAETDAMVNKSETSLAEIEKKQAKIDKDIEAVDKGKKENAETSKRLADFNTGLKILERDLKIWQRALNIDDKELKRKQGLLKKINKGGN